MDNLSANLHTLFACKFFPTKLTLWLAIHAHWALNFLCELANNGFTAFVTLETRWVVRLILQTQDLPYDSVFADGTSWQQRDLVFIEAHLANVLTVLLIRVRFAISGQRRFAPAAQETFCVEDVILDPNAIGGHWFATASTQGWWRC